MSIYSPLGYFIAITIFLGFVSIPLFAAADRPWHPETERTATIDGLRGFLATGVFFHHAIIYHRYLQDGAWVVPPSNFYTQLGQSGVTLFFMITGYLFWGKVIASKRPLNWISLYIGRIFRIGPLYFVSTGLMLLIVFWDAGFALRETWPVVLHQIAPLTALGWFTPGDQINGYQQPWVLIAGVTWTLRFEWKFYLFILPLSAVIKHLLSAPLVLPLVGLLFYLISVYRHPDTANFGYAAFFVGMTCAALRARSWIGIQSKAADALASTILLVLMFFLFQLPTAYALHPFMILAAIFACISAGGSIFGLLRARFPRRLGEISYGIYILQGLALFAVFRQPWVKSHLINSTLGYWSCVVVAGVLLISAAMLAHVGFEKPGIALGRKITAKLQNQINFKREVQNPS
jgi:peptidoglycan/LPS O-acetylase OafA/YrhL